MKTREKHKQSDKVALRFKEVREKHFHTEIIGKGKRKNHTQEDFAEYLGVSTQMIGNYEKGRNRIPEEHLIKLSKDFGIPLEYLLGQNDFRTKKEATEAHEQEKFEKYIEKPLALMDYIEKIWNLFGFDGIENKLTETEINEIRIAYTDNTSKEELSKALDDKFMHPDIWHCHRVGIQSPDGKIIYLPDYKIKAIAQDIADYAKFKLMKEFDNKNNYYYKQDMIPKK